VKTQHPVGYVIASAAVVFAAAFFVPFTLVFASGFAITAQSAGAMARSLAFTGQADDPSAVYYNPAGISQLHSAGMLLVGATVIRPHADFQPAATGSPTEERERYYVLPHLYMTHPLGPHLTAGLGAFVPFGLSTKWPADWDGRFQVIDATIRVSTFNPVLAWRPSPWLMVGGGVHYSSVKLQERRALNLAPFPAEGTVSLRGDGRTLGYNGGLLVTPSPRWQFGASYRSRTNVEVKDGRADFTVPPPLANSFTAIRTELTLPPTVRTGLLFRPTPNWDVELDAVWTGWSTIDRLEVQFANGLPSDVTTFGWRDSMTYSLGVEHRYSPLLRLRGGYLYDLTPIPDDRANPLIPDADRQGLSIGVGTSSERWTLDVGYQLLVFRRVKENDFGDRFSSTVPPVDARANGLYRSNAHVIGVSVGYRL
jgi:long-chain fatty acid transport protein